MNEIINKSSIVVVPSYYGEGFPKVLMEAAACGKPVVTTDHPGCRDAVIPGETGLLIPKKDHKALIEALNLLLSSDSKCIRMGKNGRALAEDRFGIDKVIRTHLSIYDTFMN